ncbi:hypothetical protein QNI19_09475 [Cytophagaceae bacterium DM2B3-1]|uniref:IPT/TIG domain-containing protein n=1 Tax=Xanthocytophaga flava TaxID=3048013 RepID=A0ABT7CHE7_9BACT|nr:IPT/TIG domain-containing protein [Xanthocytophaga flavus]MDJ1493159.1 hypothetical protein [Xanthocytophaga flavus]
MKKSYPSFLQIHYLIILFLVSVTLFSTSCKKEKEVTLPVITAISPDSAYIGDTVVVSGKFFESYGEDNFVLFNGKAAKLIDGNESQMRIIVPYGAETGPVVIDANHRISAEFLFKVRSRGTVITSISPTNSEEAPLGSGVVEIKGKNFRTNDFLEGKAYVNFTNSERNSVFYATDTLLMVSVPQAARTGQLSLVQEGLTFTGPVFTVKEPSLISVSPAEATEGITITLQGNALFSVNGFSINGQAINNYSILSNTEAQLTLPAGLGTGDFPIVMIFGDTPIISETKITLKPLTNIISTIYYTDGNSTYRRSIDGGGNEYNALLPISTSNRCMTVDRSAGKIYYGGFNALASANLDGTDFKVLFQTDPRGPGIVTDLEAINGKLYWTDSNNNQIKSANVDGSGTIQILYGDSPSDQITGVFGIAVVGTDIFWTDQNSQKIGKGTIDGAGTPSFMTVSGTAPLFPLDIDAIAVNGTIRIYIVDQVSNINWGEPDRILWGNINGTSVSLSSLNALSPGTGGISSTQFLTLEPAKQKVQWADNAGYSLMESNLDGSGIVTKSTISTSYVNFFIVE